MADPRFVPDRPSDSSSKALPGRSSMNSGCRGACPFRRASPQGSGGSVPRLLHSVDGVGRELVEASVGMCGKGYKEWVKVTDGGPALRLRAVIA